MSNRALELDLAGLRLLVERRGKSFAIMELISNGWDEDGVTRVDVTLRPAAGRGRVILTVVDDAPDGFKDLSHAYTLFAPSSKKSDETKRGRFNMGEKLVIALADTFEVRTTTGGVRIDVRNNTRTTLRVKRDRGSSVSAVLRMTREEMEEAQQAFYTLIPPSHILTTINGIPLPSRRWTASFNATLQTEKADEEGFLRPSRRLTSIDVYEPLPGETPSLYEMGIPVVETGDAYHVNVMQKVPLNADRDNVPPAFLRDVRTLVLNQMVHHLTPEQASTTWVSEALEDELVSAVAVTEVLAKRYGDKRVVYDPSDAEANRIALSQGYTVIPGNAFSKAAWGAVRSAGAALPAGRVTPSPKPFSPEGEPLELINVADYTPAQRGFVTAVGRLHMDLIGTRIDVQLTNDRGWGFSAVYGGGRTIFNVSKVMPDITHERTMATVLHEFAHHYGAHLTHDFDDGIAIIAARLIKGLARNPHYLTQILS
jgi:hypothetical protein